MARCVFLLVLVVSVHVTTAGDDQTTPSSDGQSTTTKPRVIDRSTEKSAPSSQEANYGPDILYNTTLRVFNNKKENVTEKKKFVKLTNGKPGSCVRIKKDVTIVLPEKEFDRILVLVKAIKGPVNFTVLCAGATTKNAQLKNGKYEVFCKGRNITLSTQAKKWKLCSVEAQTLKTNNACTTGRCGSNCSTPCADGCVNGSCDCLDGWMGDTCNETCSSGTYGFNCSKSCAEGCKNNTCNVTDGQCDCLDGWMGDICDQKCRDGQFGNYCQRNCSPGCDDSCDPVNGNCSCRAGRKGDLCEQACSSGTYGFNCSKSCAEGCKNNTCNVTDGQCDCLDGWMGDTCDQNCSYGTYGFNCSKSCAEGCKNNTCNVTDGQCDCLDGWMGDICDQKCRDGQFGNYCQRNCSPGCDDSCDPVNGYCSCRAGRKGDLCEQECFGQYGVDCMNKCSSGCNGSCDPVNGSCSCKAGWNGTRCQTECGESSYGVDCVSRCSVGCVNRKCDARTGSCQCEPGWMGDTCQQNCSSGQYGANCMKNCSFGCSGSCDRGTGHCSCKAGWIGKTCEEPCKKGQYGQGCKGACGNGCVNRSCDAVFGTCPCRAGWNGSKCTEECPEGTYSYNCSLTCSRGCSDNRCDSSTGHCAPCKQGWTGILCDTRIVAGAIRTTDGNLLLYIAVAVGTFSIVVAIGIAIICLRDPIKRMRSKGKYKLPNDPDGVTTSETHFDDKPHVDESQAAAAQDENNLNTKDEKIEETKQPPPLLETTVQVDATCAATECSGQEKPEDVADVKTNVDDPNTIVAIEPKQEDDSLIHQTILLEKQVDTSNKKGEDAKDMASQEIMSEEEAITAVIGKEIEASSCSKSGEESPDTKAIEDKTELTSTERQGKEENSVQADGRGCHGEGGSKDAPTGGTDDKDTNKTGYVSESSKTVNFVNIDETQHERKGSGFFGFFRKGTKGRQQSKKSLKRQEATDKANVQRSVSVDAANVPGASCRVKVENFPAFYQQQISTKDAIGAEFEELPSGLCASHSTALIKANDTKNRITDVYPYDHSRVSLRSPRKRGDYINASYIKGPSNKRQYIAAQGPMTTTLEDFWELIWENNVPVIAMVTNVQEHDKVVCEQYWPDQGMTSYGEWSVMCEDVRQTANYTIRTIRVKQGSHKKTVKHLQFTEWPQGGVPRYPRAVVEFRTAIRRELGDFDMGPLLVHSSTGVGRTGTFMALDYLLQEAEETGELDVYACAWKLRNQRVNMIETKEQYEFLHSCLMEAFTFINKSLTTAEFLKKSDEEELSADFDKLKAHAVADLTPAPENVEKMRADCQPPDDRDRVMLRTGENGDFINAVFVPSYRRPRGYIVTQTPLKSTLSDFWCMVFDYNIACIVLLEDSSSVQIFPSEEQKQLFTGPYSVNLLKIETHLGFFKNKLKVKMADETKEVTLIRAEPWVESTSVPSTSSHFLLLLKATTQWKNTDVPVLFVCRDAVTRCGLVCVVDTVLDQSLATGRIELDQVIRTVRDVRGNAISSLEQYQFCHEAITEHIKHSSE